MNILTSPLPETLHVDGREFPIITDFRAWLRFDAMLRDDDVDSATKSWIMLSFFDIDAPEDIPQDIEVALGALVAFFQRNTDEDTAAPKSPGGSRARVFDLAQDAPLILAAFRQAYGIDLINIDYLHWWEFLALLDGIPDDTRLAQIMQLRGMDTSDMKGKQKTQLERMQKAHAIKSASRKPMTREERDEEYLKREKARADKVRAAQQAGK